MDDLFVVGLSHQAAPIEVREKLAIPEPEFDAVLGTLAALPPVGEVMLVSTCNRVEVYGVARGGSGAEAVRDWLTARAGESAGRHLAVRKGEGALVHLFRVAASLDSMVVGEPQILGQVKESFEAASRAGVLRAELNRACQAAFAAAKRVRTDTAIGTSSVSMASVAVDLAVQVFGEVGGRKVLVVGAGTMSESCARHLVQRGAKVIVTNRTLEKAQTLAAGIGAGTEARPFSELDALLVACDVVISSTAAPRPLFTRENVSAAMKARRQRPLFLVDLAVPRDVAPEVGTLDSVFAYDVDDIEKVVAEHREARAHEAARAESIVAEEVARFSRARAVRDAVPVLGMLRKRAEELAQKEAEKTLAALGPDLTEKQRKSVEAMARAIVNKLLHEPTARLREAGAAGPEQAARLTQAAAELFGLDQTPEPAAPPPSGSASEPAPVGVPLAVPAPH